ncbi:hypothetical protein GO988_16020 [Hymenobacter sp. HMF4947]|uniref:Uncharacterized protein n=1 Tax=Hymenobacter ginkgonis TaxID=2682976 RepID=A0A7K1THF8_9BACT|nr:hypothetical protein [Hymenobacter ginkgonis]MVN77839.1 hypothetical protein [Hymenobacter ginkgonis]
MAQLPPSDLHAAIDLRFADNTTENITPEITRAMLHDLVDSLGAARAPSAYTVSLSNGKTAGTLKSGDVIAAGTPYDDTFFRRVLVEAIYPTYVPASLSLAQSASQEGEVGESVANVLTASFSPGDAGALSAIRIVKNGGQISTGGTSSPFSRNSNVVRVLGSIVFQAFASYAAGPVKLVPPANKADTRPPAIRNPDAPQAAETDLASNPVQLVGYYRLFFGPAAGAALDSAAVRALPLSQLTSTGNTGQLSTGTSATRFALVLPPGRQLLSVTDIDNQNLNLTAKYVAQPTISVNDAAGQPVAGYTPYVLSTATPYTSSARHVFTYA